MSWEFNPFTQNFDKTNRSRVEALEETYVKTGWFKQVDSGTSGTLVATAEIGTTAAFVEDYFGNDVDMLVSTVDANETPQFQPVLDATSTAISATFNTTTGAYSLSGTPTSYPIALLYGYKIEFQYFNTLQAMFESELSISSSSSTTDYHRLYVFENTTERDTFFNANPSKLTTDLLICIKDTTPPPTPGVRSLDYSKAINSQYKVLLLP